MFGIEKIVGDYRNPRSLGSRLRRRRLAPLLATIARIRAERGRVSILDVGGMERYWTIVPADDLARLGVHVTLLNLAEDLEPIERPDVFTAIEGDGRRLPHADDAFDICHSNSVIEHVFGWAEKKRFAREALRVAPRQFHQTPSFWFPWEPHFGLPMFHWLPEPIRIAITLRHDLAWTPRSRDLDDAMKVIEYATLLTRAQVAHLFPGTQVVTERLLGLPKSFVATRGVDFA
ncbi:MAG: class I SAM-dependent methyltransferase [Hyphomicrobiales bacterium]|nr:class I SAM-dependent methyltransferase [Hyphomicrobiales bacterium]